MVNSNCYEIISVKTNQKAVKIKGGVIVIVTYGDC